MIKSKLCKEIGCQNPVFSHLYCKYHQHKRTDKKPVQLKRVELKKSTKPIPKRSKKRIEDDKTYYQEKDRRSKEVGKEYLVCYISDEKMYYDYTNKKHWFDIHHLGNKIETKLLEFDRCVNVKRCYHDSLHQWSIKRLLEDQWYNIFLAKLKIEHKDMWLKEMRRQLKARLISIEEYNAL